jgi:hypothetical protein
MTNVRTVAEKSKSYGEPNSKAITGIAILAGKTYLSITSVPNAMKSFAFRNLEKIIIFIVLYVDYKSIILQI